MQRDRREEGLLLGCLAHLLAGVYCTVYTVYRSFGGEGRSLFARSNQYLKGLSHEIDFKNFDKNLQNLA